MTTALDSSFFQFWIWTNHNSLLSIAINQFASFCMDVWVTHSAAPRVSLFSSYHILTSSVIYYWTEARQHGIYLLNRCPADIYKIQFISTLLYWQNMVLGSIGWYIGKMNSYPSKQGIMCILCNPRHMSRSICGRHIDRLSADISLDIAADTLTVAYRRNIGRLSYNTSQKFRLSLSNV